MKMSALGALTVVALSLTVVCRAGTGQGVLSYPNFIGSGIIVVSAGSVTGMAACATTGRFAFNSTTAGGKSQLAGLLTAYAAGMPVTIVGNGTCNVWGDSEDINYFYIPQ